jgi:hypothetical protein
MRIKQASSEGYNARKKVHPSKKVLQASLHERRVESTVDRGYDLPSSDCHGKAQLFLGTVH